MNEEKIKERSCALIAASHQRVQEEIERECRWIMDDLVREARRLEAALETIQQKIDFVAFEIESGPAAAAAKYSGGKN